MAGRGSLGVSWHPAIPMRLQRPLAQLAEEPQNPPLSLISTSPFLDQGCRWSSSICRRKSLDIRKTKAPGLALCLQLSTETDDLFDLCV